MKKCRHRWKEDKCLKCNMVKEDYLESKKPIFNPRSPKQVGLVLQELGLPLTKFTPTKKPCTDDSVLQDLKGQHEFVDKMIEYRGLHKQVSTYFAPIYERSEIDGCIYPRFNQANVSDERLSSSEPNIQNITKKKEIGKNLRSCFIPKDGHLFVANDYSQMHLRILAHYSKDPVMVDTYRRNKDLHQMTADMLGIERKAAKAVNFGIIYSMGAPGLTQKLHEEGIEMSKEQCEDIITQFYKTYKGVDKWRRYMLSYAQYYKYAPTLFGFRVPLPFIDEKKQNSQPSIRSRYELRKAVNSPILCAEAQIVKMAMQKIYKESGLVPIFQIHDDLTYQIPIDKVEEYSKYINTTMEKIVNFNVPLTVETKIGKRWSEL